MINTSLRINLRRFVPDGDFAGEGDFFVGNRNNKKLYVDLKTGKSLNQKRIKFIQKKNLLDY